MRKRLPPLQSLLAFEATARLGVLSRAAEELALTQSAISHQIQNLEAWVGQPLFRRIGRGVQLTAAGELFSKTVGSALKVLWDGRERIEPYRNMDSVILACPAEFASGWLMPRLPLLREVHPTMEIWLITQEELKEIDDIDVDLIITNSFLDSPKLTAVMLLEDYAIAVCGINLALNLQALSLTEILTTVPLIMDEKRLEWAPWMSEHSFVNIPIQRAITIDDPRLQLAATEQNLGISMISHLTAEYALQLGQVVKVAQIPNFSLPNWWLLKSRLEPRTPAVEIVFDWLNQSAKNAKHMS